MTTGSGLHWDNGITFSATYTNGRKDVGTGSTLTFDASGSIVYTKPDNNNPHDEQTTTFDTSGRRTGFHRKSKGRMGGLLNYVSEEKNEQIFDGDGRPVIEKTGQRNYHINSVPGSALTTSVRAYQIWSSVLESSLTTITPAGNKLETKVFAGGAVIAKQKRYVDGSTNYDSIDWTTADPVTGTEGKFAYSSSGSSSGVGETPNHSGRRYSRRTRKITLPHQARALQAVRVIQSGNVRFQNNSTAGSPGCPFIVRNECL